ncbi:FAD-dependent oxidoreductase [Mesobacillus jeotgali]|uniref:FAD-dependent oxidoreductase n=1 Tax=Mesobacillus jeotgali TaxID=129985 RepID=UPI0009A8FADD|nr:FAD/NAD(P)-binding protein [Mesobacillus jeotgali]
MFEWIVVGGGIQGCTIAAFLLKNNKVLPDNLCIIDPHEKPLTNWTRNTGLIDMKFLRSPFVHHLDADPFSLISFTKKKNLKDNEFYGPYKRPSLKIFNEHSHHLFQETALEKSWQQGFVSDIDKEKDHWRVHTLDGKSLAGRNIVLALNVNDQLFIPEWADSLHEESNQVFHIFDKTACIEELKPPIAVVGGGITSAHLTIKLAAMYPGGVTLIKRHPFRVFDFDSDPGWLGPNKQTAFRQISDYERRRDVITRARNKGTLTSELFQKLKKHENEQKIKVVDGEVTSATKRDGEEITLILAQQEVNVNSIVFATGFKPGRPGGGWLDKVIEKLDLSCAWCGYPIVNPKLEWCPHLYVIGSLAELEIGPIARNISGARQAAERIVQSL